MRSRCRLLAAFGTLLVSLPTDGKLAASPARNATVTRIDEADPIQDVTLPQDPLNDAWTVSSANSPSRSKDTMVDATSRTEINREERMEGTMVERVMVAIGEKLEAICSKWQTWGWDAETLTRTKSFWELAKCKGTLDVDKLAELVSKNAQTHSRDSHVFDVELIKVLLILRDPLDVARALVSLHGMKNFESHAVPLIRELVLQRLQFSEHMSDVWNKLDAGPIELFGLLGLESGDLTELKPLIIEWHRYIRYYRQKRKEFAIEDFEAKALLFRERETELAKAPSYMTSIALQSRNDWGTYAARYFSALLATENRLKSQQASLARKHDVELSKV